IAADVVIVRQVPVADPERHGCVVDLLDDTAAPDFEIAAEAVRSALVDGVILTIEHRVTERGPALTDTSLDVVLGSLVARASEGIIKLVVAVGAVDEQSGRDVLQVGTDLEVLRLRSSRRERRRLSNRVGETTTGDLVVGSRGSELEAAELTRIAESDIPHVVL